MRWLIYGAVILAFASANAQAAEDSNAVVVQGSGATRTVSCNELEARIEGPRNMITFTGKCSGLQVRGDGNTVSVPLYGPAQIDIEGNHNRVRYTTTADASPRLHVVGNQNELIPNPYAVVPRADGSVISGNELNLDLSCNGRPFTLETVNSHIRLRGGCPAMILRGEANLIEAELAPGADVTIAGNAISLLYHVVGDGAAPKLFVAGLNSIALPASSIGAALIQPTTPAKLPVPLLMQLVGAQVQAQGTLVHLPIAAFNGNSNSFSPAGELTLRRLAGLLVQAWPSGVKITGYDTDPDTGRTRASAVSDYLIAHGAPGLAPALSGDKGDPAVDIWLLK